MRLTVRIVIVLSTTIFARGVSAWYPYDDRYEAWQRTRPITMGAWHNSVPRDYLPERIARFKAAGLNTFFWCKPNNAQHFFKAAVQGGLEWQCSMRGPRDALQEALGIGRCTAIIVADEPNTVGRTEEQQEQVFRDLSERIRWVHENYPDLLAFANLSILEIHGERYITECKPDVFSFDMYPLYRDGATASHYLHLVGVGREFARTHRLPYWMILQAYGRSHERTNYAYRIPDEADMRFLVFSLLAHGGVGMHFFMYYGHTESMVYDKGVREPGREPAENHKFENMVMSRAYVAVRDLAPEVHNLGRALLNLRTKGEIGYVGPIPEKCHAFKPHSRLKSIQVVDEPEATALTSFFDDQAGQEYFMVVNLKHGANLSKMDAAETVRLSFSDEIEAVERLNRLTGMVELLRTSPAQGGSRVLDVHLEGGTGDLFHWHNGKPWDLRPQ